MIKVYLAGKVTGNPNYKADFRAVREAIAKDYPDAVVLNPADLPEGMRPADYMGICIPMLMAADVVLMLPNYRDSAGARLEKALCDYIGKPTHAINHPESIIHPPKGGTAE